MKEKTGGKNNYIILVSIIITLMLITSVIIIFYFNKNDDSELYDWLTIDFTISSNNSEQKIIYLPIPINGFANSIIEDEGMPIDELDNMSTIEGNGSFSIIEDNEEYFLKINFSNSIHIIFNETYGTGSISPEAFQELSSDRIFVNATTDSEIIIDYYIEYSIGNIIGVFELNNFHADAGWQYVDIEEEVMIFG